MIERGVCMDVFQVTFVNENKTISVKEETTVLEAMRMAGLSADAPCGGMGTCGKCQVKVDGALCLSCQERIEEDITVETLQREKSHRILVSGTKREVPFLPFLSVKNVQIEAYRIGESTSDWDRLCLALGGTAKDYEPNLSVLESIARVLREHQGKARVVLRGNRILDVRPQGAAPVRMAAFDIGTTTVAGYLLDGESGKELASASSLNPQTEYGADVIMRADYCLKYSSEALADCIRKQLGKLLKELCRKDGCVPEDIFQISIVGNTCMHHLFLGISPDSLVHAPYNPSISCPLILPAKDYGLEIHPFGEILMLPVIAGFVGADTVGCLLAANLEEEEKMTLLIDIGTNGEIVLGNKNRRIACSTAAGPAFEGAKIACGMRGAEGAISHAHLENGKLKCQVIGGGRPAGICGSGLIDVLACLLEAGIVDESGRLEESCPLSEDGSVYLTQKDIREVQLAKAAIAAGIRLLVDKMGISMEEISQVYIAGAFGNYMDPKNACRIGLLPSELEDRIVPVGNAAGEGAKLALQNRDEFARARRLALHTEFLELAALPEFQDCFIDELEFPE